MRILYISNSTGGGGAPASLYNLIEGLACRHKIGVVLPQASGDLYDKLQDLGVKIYDSVPYVLDIWPKTYNPFRFISKCIKLCKNRSSVRSYIGSIIDDFHPDIVHTNVGPLSIGVEETIKRGIPHVWHMREYQDKDFSMTFFPSRRAFINLIHSDNNHNISITQDIFRHWNLRTGKDIVVYNAIRRVPDKPVTESADKGYFLYVGRIEKSKGLMTLLKAFKQYKDGADFLNKFSVTENLLQEMLSFATEQKVEKENLSDTESSEIKQLMKSYIAQNLYGDEYFYPLFLLVDEDVQKALPYFKK